MHVARASESRDRIARALREPGDTALAHHRVDTRALLMTLASRMTRENDELYPLVDAAEVP